MHLIEVDQDGYDAVVSDSELDGPLTGVDLAEFVRNLRPELPFVLCTAQLDYGDIRSDIDVLLKPFDLSTLGNMLQALIYNFRMPS